MSHQIMELYFVFVFFFCSKREMMMKAILMRNTSIIFTSDAYQVTLKIERVQLFVRFYISFNIYLYTFKIKNIKILFDTKFKIHLYFITSNKNVHQNSKSS